MADNTSENHSPLGNVKTHLTIKRPHFRRPRRTIIKRSGSPKRERIPFRDANESLHTTKTFTLFPKLPLGIQRMIWYFSVLAPRKIDMYMVKLRSIYEFRRREPYIERILHFRPKQTNPPQFETCRESRNIACKRYATFLMCRAWAFGDVTLYLNSENDTLYFDREIVYSMTQLDPCTVKLDGKTWKVYWGHGSLENSAKLKFLELDATPLLLRPDKLFEVATKLVRYMDLEVITLILHLPVSSSSVSDSGHRNSDLQSDAHARLQSIASALLKVYRTYLSSQKRYHDSENRERISLGQELSPRTRASHPPVLRTQIIIV